MSSAIPNCKTVKTAKPSRAIYMMKFLRRSTTCKARRKLTDFKCMELCKDHSILKAAQLLYQITLREDGNFQNNTSRSGSSKV
jgi:hypothetical protein